MESLVDSCLTLPRVIVLQNGSPVTVEKYPAGQAVQELTAVKTDYQLFVNKKGARNPMRTCKLSIWTRRAWRAVYCACCPLFMREQRTLRVGGVINCWTSKFRDSIKTLHKTGMYKAVKIFEANLIILALILQLAPKMMPRVRDFAQTWKSGEVSHSTRNAWGCAWNQRAAGISAWCESEKALLQQWHDGIEKICPVK